MTLKTVYLAGPIEGCTEEEIFQWRSYVKDLLEDGIRAISPRTLDSSKASEVTTQSFMDVDVCDVVLAYVPKSINKRRCSYGTICEIAWAYTEQTPIVIVSDDDYIHEHPIMKTMGVHFYSFGEAIEYINNLLIDYV